MRRIACLVLALVLGAGSRLAAQSPAERSNLDSLHAAYEARADTAWLIQREAELIAIARLDRDNVMRHMELGWLSYRLGELTGVKKRYEDAASEFQWVSDLKPDWPYGWYWLGLSEVAVGESGVIILENIKEMLGLDFLSRAVHAFARAVEVDPGFARGLVDLAATAMRQRVSPRLEVARAALRQAAATPAGRVPEVQLARGRVEQRLGSVDSALDAFRQFLVVGGDSAIGAVEVARMQAVLGRRDSAVRYYYVGVSRPLSDSARANVRRDLRWIATAPELAAFDHAPPESVATFLRGFWEGRDAADGRHAGERLSEQFRRYQHAVESFGLISRRRRQAVTLAFRDSTQSDFDDRGIVYLRHGEPAERAQYVAPGFDANESWLYHLGPPNGDLILHFAAFGAAADYRLMESLRAVCQRQRGPMNTLSGANLALGRTPFDNAVRAEALNTDFSGCVQSRAPLSSDYERLSHFGGQTAESMWASERQHALAMVRGATTTDSYAHHFESTLRPFVSWFIVADSAMRPELHLVFAVSATRLHPQFAGDGAANYPLTLRLVVTDGATGRPVAVLDTLRVFRSTQRLGQDAFLTEQLSLRVPVGGLHFAFVIAEEQASAGDALTRMPLDVGRLDRGFAASDAVLGRAGSGLVWRRGSGDVPLNPLSRFPRDGEITLFYELYGLPQSTSVPTRVTVTPAQTRSLLQRIFGGGGGAADLAYSTVTEADGRASVRQRIALRGLSPGRYTLRLELTDPASGAHVVRVSPFEIEDR